MSCLSYPSTAELRAERISQSKRSNLPAAHFPSSSGCSLTYFYLWNRKLAASPKKRSFLRAQTSEHTKDSIEKNSRTDPAQLGAQTENGAKMQSP
jgi:hypothetical protein